MRKDKAFGTYASSMHGVLIASYEKGSKMSATYFFFNPEFFLDVHVFQGNDSFTGRFF